MKVLAIVGSPRKKSNTDILVDKVIEGISSVTEVDSEKIYIVDKKINYCTGCGFHLRQADKVSGKMCSQDDDMIGIHREMIEADALIFGTPVHMRTLSAPMLNFLTRSIPLLKMKPIFDENGKIVSAEVNSLLKGKKVASVVSQGDPMAYSGALAIQVLAINFTDLMMKYVGDLLSTGNIKRGMAAEREDELKRAFELGVRIAS
ncbi:MAG: flavodoxin family protein [Candidatus Schekmanbacteria bacterium]|nr:MAG: flavodoxin family protein [Candidatus Schekmanbacteria bacterium]